MKLHSPQFERALRRGVKSAVRASPEMLREFRRCRSGRRPVPLAKILLLWLAFPAASVVVVASAATSHVATGLAIINLMMLGALPWLAQGLWARIHLAYENQMLAFLPITRQTLFRWNLQKFVLESLPILFALLGCFAGLALFTGLSPVKWVAAGLIAVLSWATLLALAAFCMARIPKAPLEFISVSLILTSFVVFGSKHVIQPMALHFIDQAAPELNLILPTGWPVSLFQVLTDGNPAWFLIPLLPTGLLLWSARLSIKAIFDSFEYREYVHDESADLVTIDTGGGEPPVHNPLQLGQTAIEEIIQSRSFLNWPRWPQRGWLERLLWRWFQPREKVLSEFVFPNGYAITTPWLIIFKCLGVAALVAFAAGLIGPAFRIWALGIGLFAIVGLTLGQIINSGRAFLPLRFSGTNIPMYAGYGIGIRELSRLLFKCSIIQIPLLLAFALAAGATTAWLAGFGLGLGMIFGFKAACLLFASRFIFMTLSFSAGTNDTTRLRVRSILLVTIIVMFGLVFVALGGSGLFVRSQPTAWLLCLGATVDAYAFFWIYQWFYLSGRFDLLSSPRR